MNKAEFIKELSKKTKLTQKDCANCLNSITALVSNTLKQGESISLVGFGKFDVKHRKARLSYNPATKRQVMLPATVVPYFKAGKTLKEYVS